MSRYTVLHSGTGWALGLWRCDAPEPGPAAPERTDEHHVAFPTHGVYGRRIDGRRELLDATRVVYFNASQWYEVDHPVGGGDRCTVLSLDPALVEALAAQDRGIRDAAGAGPRFTATSRAAGAELHLGQRTLVARAKASGPDPLALDALAFGVLDAALPDRDVHALARPGGSGRARGHRGRTTDHRGRAVARAIEKIHADYRTRLTLAEIARAAAYSPFHLCRVFREVVGVSLHGYVNRLRLRQALDEVLEGRTDLGTLALRHGFSSHSHFTHAFRREFRTTPAALRATRFRTR